MPVRVRAFHVQGMHHRRASVGDRWRPGLPTFNTSCFRADSCRQFLGHSQHGPLTVSTLTSPPHNFRNRVFLSRALPILYVLQNPVLVPWRLKRDAISTEMIAVAL